MVMEGFSPSTSELLTVWILDTYVVQVSIASMQLCLKKGYSVSVLHELFCSE